MYDILMVVLLAGVGRTMPDPKGAYVTKDGITIPMGKPVDTQRSNLLLLYNELVQSRFFLGQTDKPYLIS